MHNNGCAKFYLLPIKKNGAKMKNKKTIISVIFMITLFFYGCAEKKKVPKPENFLTLADLTGRVSLKEDSPDVRVIRVKAKAFIKLNDIRSAKAKALEIASSQAVDVMVRELLKDEEYNNSFSDIEEYISRNVQNYIVSSEVNDEKKIFGGKYYGIDSAFKVNRQKVLVALQGKLKLIDMSASTLVPVITSKKNIDVSSLGISSKDLEEFTENAMMNQIQSDLNQRGLRAMDFRNAITSIQTDAKIKKQFAKISKKQFLALVSGSSAERALLDTQIQDAEKFYTTGLSLLKQIAKVVVEVNILAVNRNAKGDMALTFNVTAKNISTGRGGAFANNVFTVARKGSIEGSISSAMVGELVNSAYFEMQKKFIPQVINEMSTISVGGSPLIPYELVLKDFKGSEIRKLRTKLKQSGSDDFRYISFDNTVPTIVSIKVRHAGNLEDLGDKIMIIFDSYGIRAKEPIVAPDLTDLVFLRLPDEE